LNSLAQHLAVEEPKIASIAIGPGRVDTDMQKELREKGSGTMSESDYAGFKTAFEEGKLNKPEWPGHVIARLALGTKPELSGKYLRYVCVECNPTAVLTVAVGTRRNCATTKMANDCRPCLLSGQRWSRQELHAVKMEWRASQPKDEKVLYESTWVFQH
jgi:hypothetical protein